MSNPNKKPILHGYKKEGTKFIPPIMQIPNIKEINYVNQILPELLWMGLLNEKYGYQKGTELVESIATKAFSLKEIDNHINFSLISNYDLLSIARKAELVSLLNNDKTLPLYQEALAPFLILYDNFPLSFLGLPSSYVEKTILVKQLQECIKNHYDKYKTPSLAIQANVIYVKGRTGGLHIAPHIEPPNLNALIEAPDSDEAKKASGFVRTSVLNECGFLLQDTSINNWAKIFWNQGYFIDKCSFIKEEL